MWHILVIVFNSGIAKLATVNLQPMAKLWGLIVNQSLAILLKNSCKILVKISFKLKVRFTD